MNFPDLCVVSSIPLWYFFLALNSFFTHVYIQLKTWRWPSACFWSSLKLFFGILSWKLWLPWPPPMSSIQNFCSLYLETSLLAISWSLCHLVHVGYFLFLMVHCPALPVVQCLKTIVLCIFFVCFCCCCFCYCFEWESKYGPFHLSYLEVKMPQASPKILASSLFTCCFP